MFINGAYVDRISSWQNGKIPGTFNTYGCYQRVSSSLRRGARYTVRTVYGGARATDYCPECSGSNKYTLHVKYPSDRTTSFIYR